MTPRLGPALLTLVTLVTLFGACDRDDSLRPACSDFVGLGTEDGQTGLYYWQATHGEMVYVAPGSRVDPATALSSTRDRLAFVHGGKLHIVNVRSGAEQTVDDDADAPLIDWVGEHLVLASHGRLELVDTATLARTTLVEGGADITALHLSPDGQTVGFVRDFDLLALPVTGGEPVELVDVAVSDFAGWSFEGKHIAYLTPLARALRIVDVASGTVPILGDSFVTGAAWSPATARLLYETEGPDSRISLVAIDADDTHRAIIGSRASTDAPLLATWSGDGEDIVWHGRPAELAVELGPNPLVSSNALAGGHSRLLHHDWPERAYLLAQCEF